MKPRQQAITDKATALVEHHSTLAMLLAVLCLVFAVNYFFAGPGSDGGSGLGGTGKFGGESGLGGTGKTPDSGPTFKLGANDDQDATDKDRALTPGGQELQDLLNAMGAKQNLLADTGDVLFDVNSLRLSLDTLAVAPIPRNDADRAPVAALVGAINLDAVDIDDMMASEKGTISANALVSSAEILNGLMVAEARTSLELATSATDEVLDSHARSRVNMPVRPERPDRLNIPTRVTAVQRSAIPAPPPVRPMRTLSSLLNH